MVFASEIWPFLIEVLCCVSGEGIDETCILQLDREIIANYCTTCHKCKLLLVILLAASWQWERERVRVSIAVC